MQLIEYDVRCSGLDLNQSGPDATHIGGAMAA
jgi:hypothetical protein